MHDIGAVASGRTWPCPGRRRGGLPEARGAPRRRAAASSRSRPAPERRASRRTSRRRATAPAVVPVARSAIWTGAGPVGRSARRGRRTSRREPSRGRSRRRRFRSAGYRGPGAARAHRHGQGEAHRARGRLRGGAAAGGRDPAQADAALNQARGAERRFLRGALGGDRRPPVPQPARRHGGRRGRGRRHGRPRGPALGLRHRRRFHPRPGQHHQAGQLGPVPAGSQGDARQDAGAPAGRGYPRRGLEDLAQQRAGGGLEEGAERGRRRGPTA